MSSCLTSSQLTPGKSRALHTSNYMLKIQSIISSSDPLDWLPHGPFHTMAPKNLQSHHTSNECSAPSPKFPHPLGSSGVLPHPQGPASFPGSCLILWGPASSSTVCSSRPPHKPEAQLPSFPWSLHSHPHPYSKLM